MVTRTGQRCIDCELSVRKAPLGDAGGSIARSPEEAEARDRAMLAHLVDGPTSFDHLARVMPGTFETSAAREAACRSTLLRLKVKKQIRLAPEGYALP